MDPLPWDSDWRARPHTHATDAVSGQDRQSEPVVVVWAGHRRAAVGIMGGAGTGAVGKLRRRTGFGSWPDPFSFAGGWLLSPPHDGGDGHRLRSPWPIGGEPTSIMAGPRRAKRFLGRFYPASDRPLESDGVAVGGPQIIPTGVRSTSMVDNNRTPLWFVPSAVRRDAGEHTRAMDRAECPSNTAGWRVGDFSGDCRQIPGLCSVHDCIRHRLLSRVCQE